MNGRHGTMLSVAYASIWLLIAPPTLVGQPGSASPAAAEETGKTRGLGYIYNFLQMAGTATVADYRPQSQAQRTADYVKTMTNPLFFFKGALSGGLDHWRNKPQEWEQGWGPYGQRVGNIVAQYAIRETVMFGVASALREDNRYFGSGKRGIWPRLGYATSSSIMARREDERRSVSASRLAGLASAAFVSRLWHPAGERSARDGAVSLGISLGGNVAVTVVKEFLPDIARMIRLRKSASRPAQTQFNRGLRLQPASP